MLTINTKDAVPIWKQIEQEIRRLVATGRLIPGEAVPSVREVAKDLRVNPATVQKAYQRLCEEGLLAVRRGEGTFVEASPLKTDAKHRREELQDAAVRYASLAATIGASTAEAQRIVTKEIERVMNDGSKGAK